MASLARGLLVAALGLASTFVPVHAGAVLVDGSDGNTTPPPVGAGGANVGVCGGLTAIYLGNRWVLTAWHVPSGAVSLNGVAYGAVAGSDVALSSGALGPADLKLFRIAGDPGLPYLVVASQTPALGSTLVLSGNGRDRAQPVTWKGFSGWSWATTSHLRWGTNAVQFAGLTMPLSGTTTWAFASDFSAPGAATLDEAQATAGDSGGAVFSPTAEGWALSGVVLAISPYVGQPANTSLHGNFTYIADLSRYRDQIQATAGLPAGPTVSACGLLGIEAAIPLGVALLRKRWSKTRRPRT